MELHESQLPSTHELKVTMTMSDIEVAEFMHNAPERIMERVAERVVQELLPIARDEVASRIDYDAIGRAVQTAIQARLLEAQLGPFKVR